MPRKPKTEKNDNVIQFPHESGAPKFPDDSKVEIKSAGTPLEQLRFEITSGVQEKIDAEKDKAKIGRPKKADAEKAAKATVTMILDTPFQVSAALTGYNGFGIPEGQTRENLIQAGYQVYQDFGAEVYQKWVNLAVFALMYGGIFIVQWREYLETKKAAAKAAKAEKAAAAEIPAPNGNAEITK